MIVLGQCSQCTPCGSGATCDTIAFLIDASHRDAISTNYGFYGSEGTSITFTVARLPQCFSYHGAPADFETAAGYPPPVYDGQYFYDTTGAGQFWLNTAGVYSTAPAPAFYGNGSITVEWAVTTTECGCPHMIANATGSLSWGAGDVSNKSFTVPVTCPGPPTYWGCEGAQAGGEIATVSLSQTGGTGCAFTGENALALGVCTHTSHPDFGVAPYYIRRWAAVASPTPGFLQLDWDGTSEPIDRYLESVTSALYLVPTSVGANQTEKGYYQYGGVLKYLRFTGTDASRFASGPIPPWAGGPATSPDTFTSPELDIALSEAGSAYPVPLDAADALLADAVTADPDGASGIWRWNEVFPEYVFKIRGDFINTIYGFDYITGPFDSGKTYEYTGPQFEGPQNIADWTEIPDTGLLYSQEISGTYNQEFEFVTGTTFSGAAGRMRGVEFLLGLGGLPSVAVWRSEIDATNSRNGSPNPQTVEIRLVTYEDDAVIDDSGWFDITDTSYAIDPPADLGGASMKKWIDVHIRTAPVGSGCAAAPSLVFVCHPGLSCP